MSCQMLLYLGWPRNSIDREMPKKEHARLLRRAKKLGLTGKRKDAYVYGTLHKIEEAKKRKKKK